MDLKTAVVGHFFYTTYLFPNYPVLGLFNGFGKYRFIVNLGYQIKREFSPKTNDSVDCEAFPFSKAYSSASLVIIKVALEPVESSHLFE